ncbi:Cytochrome P450 4d2, partial [Pseudolycoriella hygida]
MSLIILILVGLLILYISQINFRKIYLSLKFPGPFPLPFVGNALYYLNKSPTEIMEISVKFYGTYGDVFGLWVGSEFYVVLSDPKDLEVMLSSSKFIEKGEPYRYIKGWLNEGLLVSSGTLQ